MGKFTDLNIGEYVTDGVVTGVLFAIISDTEIQIAYGGGLITVNSEGFNKCATPELKEDDDSFPQEVVEIDSELSELPAQLAEHLTVKQACEFVKELEVEMADIELTEMLQEHFTEVRVAAEEPCSKTTGEDER